MDIKDFLGTLIFHFERGKLSYESYLKSGNNFLYARILKDNNSAIKKLLLSNGHILPTDLKQDALQILAHLDVWHELWDDLKHQLEPSLNDVFIFQNDHSFPKDSEKALIYFFNSLE